MYLTCLHLIFINTSSFFVYRSLSNDRPCLRHTVNGNSSSPEVCLYSQTHFLHFCDIWTTSEVSQLFQWINHGSGSSYLTFTVLTQYFVVLFFYLFNYPDRTSNRLVHVQTTLFSSPPSTPRLSCSSEKLQNLSCFAFMSIKKKNQHSPRAKWLINSFSDDRAILCVCVHTRMGIQWKPVAQ